jgi:phosphomevalonate kinase
VTDEEIVVSAPGKVILIGEYAVLRGHPAVVAAVDRRVIGRFVPKATPSTPLAKNVVEAVNEYLLGDGGTPPDGAPELDSSALFAATGKIGLGSSAAATAAGVGVMLEASGCDIEYTRSLALTLAHRAHRTGQGGIGSGADVAAAVHGGVIYYARRETEVDVYPIELPADVEVIVFSTGTPSSTVDATSAFLAWLDYDRSVREERLAALGALANDFVSACASDDPRGVVDAAARANTLLASLGRDVDLPIVTPVFAEAAKLAESLGGAAKPSGAGGGDVGVAFLTDQKAAETFRQRAAHLGLEILSIRTGADGLRREPSGPERNEDVVER